MENLLQGIPRVCVYLDDILVTGLTEEEHLANLAQVLTRLETAGMRLKCEKCAFMLGSASYLGHVISKEGLSTGTLKAKAIVDAPDPKDLSVLHSFWAWSTTTGNFFQISRLLWLHSTIYTISRQCGTGDQSRRRLLSVSRSYCNPTEFLHSLTISCHFYSNATPCPMA